MRNHDSWLFFSACSYGKISEDGVVTPKNRKDFGYEVDSDGT